MPEEDCAWNITEEVMQSGTQKVRIATHIRSIAYRTGTPGAIDATVIPRFDHCRRPIPAPMQVHFS
jgi:hypothetical protein